MSMSLCQFAFAAVLFSSLLLTINGLKIDDSRDRRAIIPAPSSDTVGNCTSELFKYNELACGLLLYKPYRSESKSVKTCRDQVPNYLECIRMLYQKCFANGRIADFSYNMHVRSLQSMNFTIAFCDYGGYPDQTPPETQGFCKDIEFKPAYAKCIADFRTLFVQNHGDPKLCFENGKTTKCVITAMESHCSGESIDKSVKISTKLNINRINPFCAMSQGGADADVIVSGKLLDPADSGANVPHLSMLFASFLIMIVHACLH